MIQNYKNDLKHGNRMHSNHMDKGVNQTTPNRTGRPGLNQTQPDRTGLNQAKPVRTERIANRSHSSLADSIINRTPPTTTDRGRKLYPTGNDRLRKSHSLSTDRGRKPPPSPRHHSPAAGPIRAHHYTGLSFVRERSPHIAMDRLTRNASPARVRKETEDDVINARIPQPYRTSFSAVTSPQRVKKSQSVRSPMVTTTRPNFIGGNPLGLSRGFTGKSSPSQATSHSTIQNGSRSDLDENQPSQRYRSGSRDLVGGWSHDQRSCDESSDMGQISSERLGSYDALNGREDTLVYTANFDSRRLNPKYSSTPTRLPTSPLVTAVTNGNGGNHDNNKYSRLESNISADTLDSVFMPNTPSSPVTDHDISLDYLDGDNRQQTVNSVNSKTTASDGTEEPSLEISKPPDSGFVEGRVEKRTCVEREYVHIVEISHEDLMKEKKKKRLPEANAETVSLVREMMNNLERRIQSRSASAPGTPLHSTQIDGLKKKHRNKEKSSLGKKSLSSSITNFFRKITQSPQTLKRNTKNKKGKRSKSAGRLEGNRSVGGSNSSLGYREISLEPTSTGSSDQSAAFLHANHSSTGPIRDHGTNDTSSFSSSNNKNRSQAKSTSYLDDKENSLNNGANLNSNNKSMILSNNTTSSNTTSQDQPYHNNSNKPTMPSTRVYLKSIEDNNAINRGDDKNVYRTFKEKQSPSYHRHADVGTMKTQALKVVGGKSGVVSSPGGLSPGVTVDAAYIDERRTFHLPVTHCQSYDTIGDCSLDFNAPGTDPSITSQPSADPSKVSLRSRDNVFSNGVHSSTDKEHLQNGGIAEVHATNGVSQQKSPSYVKISCAISGYKAYGTKPQSTNKQNIQVNANNNVMPVNGDITYTGDNPCADVDSGPVYSPTGSSYVKGLSKKFETLNNTDQTNRDVVASPSNKAGMKPKGNSVSPVHTGNQTGANYTQRKDLNNSSRTEQQSQALPKSTNGPTEACVVDTKHEDNDVDSKNIDFKQARRAFDSSSQPIRSADYNTSSTMDNVSNSVNNASSSKYAKTVTHGGDVSSAELHLDLGSLTRVNGIDSKVNSADRSLEGDYDTTDNVAVLHTLHNNVINSIDGPLFDESNDKITRRDDNSKPVIENGFVIEAEEVSTPSHVRVEELRDNSTAIAATADTGFNKSSGSLHSSQDISSLSCQSSTEGLNSSSSSIYKDGRYYLTVCEQEEVEIQQLCQQAQGHFSQTLSDEVLGKIRAAIGKGNLLTTKKFKQFKGLCDQNLTQAEDSSFQTTAQDLAGFWDMVLIQVDDVKALFKELNKLRDNGWKASPKHSPQPRKPVGTTPKSTSKKSSRGGATPMSAKAQEAAKARAEARRKLLEAKKAGRQQRKTSESEDVEIFVS